MTNTILVDYPLGGRHLLLHWWTQEDRGHVVLARSERALVETTRRIFVEEPYAEIRAAMAIDVVAPPLSLERGVMVARRAWDVDDFKMVVCAEMCDVVKAGGTLPPPFERCADYKPEEGVRVDEWARESHYGCVHCAVGVRLVGLTADELYDRCHAEWNALMSSGASPKRDGYERYESRAARASDETSLWVARKNFGHHASGVELLEDPTPAGLLRTEALFFFRRIGDVGRGLRARLDRMRAEAEEQAKEKQRERDAARKSEYDDKCRARREKGVQFFASRFSKVLDDARLTWALHERRRHPDYEYATTECGRKAGPAYPPEGEGWEPNDYGPPHPSGGDNHSSWERFDYHEEHYWRRKKAQP